MNAATAETLQPESQPVTKPRRKPGPPPKSQYQAQKDMFAACIYDGQSAPEAAKSVGVSLTTATRWAAKVRAGDKPGSREQLVNKLRLWLNDPSTAIQYRAPIATLYANLHRWLKDDGNQVVLKPMGSLFDAWRAEISATMTASAASTPAKALGE